MVKNKNRRKQIRLMKLWYLKLFPFQVSLQGAPGVTESLGAQHLESPSLPDLSVLFQLKHQIILTFKCS